MFIASINNKFVRLQSNKKVISVMSLAKGMEKKIRSKYGIVDINTLNG